MENISINDLKNIRIGQVENAESAYGLPAWKDVG